MTFPTNGPTTLELVKAHLGIEDATDDAAITAAVAAVNEVVKSWPVAQIANTDVSLEPSVLDRMLVGAPNTAVGSWWGGATNYVEFREVTATQTGTVDPTLPFTLDGVAEVADLGVTVWLKDDVPELDQIAPWGDSVGFWAGADPSPIDIEAGVVYVLSLECYQNTTDHTGQIADFGNVVELVKSAAGGPTWVQPEFAHIVHGSTLLAARLFRRRNSPDGVASFGDGSPAYLARTDPDVALLLQIGTNAAPGVG